MNILVFDIETIPDIESGRRLYQLEGLSEEEVYQAMIALKRAKSGTDFLPHHLQRIVAISLVFVNTQQIKVWSLGDESSSEQELISRFFKGIDQNTPTLISWNGSGFDLPVLHYRSLLHKITASMYWESGENLQSFRWNNYLSRFHYRHIDLMDILAGYQNKAFAPLDEISTLLGFPGKMGMNGAHVYEAYLNGNIKSIRDYCETDVLNTYCVYLRFELMRGTLSYEGYTQEMQRLRDYLKIESDKSPHLGEFLEAMKET